MKKFTLFVIVLTIATSSYAKIWRVNNNAGVTADFTTLAAAHTGANSGDTLYIEASPTSYGGATFTKRLTVIGAGFFLDQNLNLQASAHESNVDAVFLNAGSAGTILEGLTFNTNPVYVSVNDVIIRRNNFGTVYLSNPDWNNGVIHIGYYGPANNIVISQNIFLHLNNNNNISNGLLILNNVFATGVAYGANNTGDVLVLHANTIALIKNNIFRRGTVRTYNSNLSNNIMFQGLVQGTGNLLSNNIGNGTQFGTTDGNQSNVVMSNVFELTGSYDATFKLKAGSPAIGAGYGSTSGNPIDCGIFGGSTPYVLSGLPAIPSIYYFTNQPVGSNSDPIDVQIKVRSNN